MRAVWFILFLLMAVGPLSAQASSYDVSNVQVSIESADAVKARDQAIIRAQRVAFAQLIGKDEDGIKSITDDQIARLVSGFSVRGERSVGHSYKANFTVRFEPTRTQYFIDEHAWTLVNTAMIAPVSVSNTATVTTTTTTTTTDTAVIVPLLQTIAILPVLDIGSRRVVWDEPNPWRDVWQKKDYSSSKLKVMLPLGDANDITDIPDAAFLAKSGTAQVEKFLTRYNAQALYIVVAKNQGAALDPSGGMAISLYKHDGKQLNFIKKNVIRPRPGYVFDDAVPAGMQMILQAQGLMPAQQDIAPLQQPQTVQVGGAQDMVVTVPYQSLAQWVGIQQNLRRVSGIQNIAPIRVSPSSAQVRLSANIMADDLRRNLAMQGFDLQAMPNGEMVLTER